MSILNTPIPEMYKLIVLDDDVKIHKIINKFFEKEKLLVKSILKPDDIFNENLFEYDAILLDFYYQDQEQNGLEIIKNIREINKYINIILMTGFSSETLAIQAIQFNIDDYILKPINFKSLASVIINIIEKKRGMFNLIDFKPNIIQSNIFQNIIILNNSVPIFAYGSWVSNGLNISNSEIILGGFFTAIQNFSSVYFGQSLNEISLANENILFYRQEELIICLRITNAESKSVMSIKNKKIILDQLKAISDIINASDDFKKQATLSKSTKDRIISMINHSNTLLLPEDPSKSNIEYIRIKKEKIINFIEKINEKKINPNSKNLEKDEK